MNDVNSTPFIAKKGIPNLCKYAIWWAWKVWYLLLRLKSESAKIQFQNHRCWQKRFIWISAALCLNILFTQEGCRSLFPALAGQFKSTGGLYRWINEKVNSPVNLLVIVFFNLWNRWSWLNECIWSITNNCEIFSNYIILIFIMIT